MAQFALGTRPVGFVVVLNSGSVFRAKLRNKNWPWPTGTLLQLKFSNGVTWTATYADRLAIWDRSASDVYDASSAETVELYYVTESGPVRWARGKVEVIT